MTELQILSAVGTVAYVILHLFFMVRILIRPHREPASRFAWMVVIIVIPVAGIVGYILLGETNIGRRRVARMRKVVDGMPDISSTPGINEPAVLARVSERWEPLFQMGRTVNGFDPVGGNQGRLLQDSNTAIDTLVSDIDAATHSVHLIFYIWLPDNNGMKVVEALKRAAARGATCRAMADGLGSRTLIRSPHWQAMKEAGVKVAEALPTGLPLLGSIKGRVDLRNHRKIVVIDNRLTYCGSQNCADPEFLVKAKYAPWVDIMVRFEGPIARQNQHLFASDWMAHVDEDLSSVLLEPLAESSEGLTTQVIGTGPTVRTSAMPEVFESLMYSARKELFITTPYYVPDESMQAALCASARRGVLTTIIFPARNDSWIVGAASRSYYAELLEAGVRIVEYHGGLLHTKSMTIDGEISLIGSANMDRRSFELNYENNILLQDPDLTAAIRERQEVYLKSSSTVTREMVADWTIPHRLWNNAIAMLGPVL